MKSKSGIRPLFGLAAACCLVLPSCIQYRTKDAVIARDRLYPDKDRIILKDVMIAYYGMGGYTGHAEPRHYLLIPRGGGRVPAVKVDAKDEPAASADKTLLGYVEVSPDEKRLEIRLQAKLGDRYRNYYRNGIYRLRRDDSQGDSSN